MSKSAFFQMHGRERQFNGKRFASIFPVFAVSSFSSLDSKEHSLSADQDDGNFVHLRSDISGKSIFLMTANSVSTLTEESMSYRADVIWTTLVQWRKDMPSTWGVEHVSAFLFLFPRPYKKARS